MILLVFGVQFSFFSGRNQDEAVGFDPFGGVEDEAGDEGADADLSGVRRSFDDEALELFVPRVLPLGNDLHLIADFERLGAVAGDGLVHGIGVLGVGEKEMAAMERVLFLHGGPCFPGRAWACRAPGLPLAVRSEMGGLVIGGWSAMRFLDRVTSLPIRLNERNVSLWLADIPRRIRCLRRTLWHWPFCVKV